jgi:hypothetical protein
MALVRDPMAWWSAQCAAAQQYYQVDDACLEQAFHAPAHSLGAVKDRS